MTKDRSFPSRVRAAAGVAALAAGLLGACASSAAPQGNPADAPGAAQPETPVTEPDVVSGDKTEAAPVRILSETVTLSVTGMTCPVRCVREVKEMLRPVAGVQNVFVDYDRREVTVHVEPGTDPQSLVNALRAPYTARVVR